MKISQERLAEIRQQHEGRDVGELLAHIDELQTDLWAHELLARKIIERFAIEPPLEDWGPPPLQKWLATWRPPPSSQKPPQIVPLTLPKG